VQQNAMNNAEPCEFLPQGMRRDGDPLGSVVFVHGSGVRLIDENGKEYLDFVSGYSSLSFGHSHPRLVKAAVEQLSTLVHLVGLRHPWRERLAERLSGFAPGQLGCKSWISTTGSRAVEIAIKVALLNRPGKIVSFQNAYHGRSLGTAHLSDTQKISCVPYYVSPQDESSGRFSLSLDEVLRYPIQSDVKVNGTNLRLLDDHAEEISAIMIEPALGARGYYPADVSFLYELRRWTEERKILLISDEVQMGLGRLVPGVFVGWHQGWNPDLAILGKSLGGGLVPISAVVGRSELMDMIPQGVESETFAADPLVCRIALEALSLFEDDVKPKWSQLNSLLIDEAQRIQAKFKRNLGDAVPVQLYVVGQSLVVEFINTDRYGPARLLAEACCRRSLDAGLLTHWSGIHRDRIVLIPPLIITPDDLRAGIEIIEKAIEQIQQVV
jgi:4-aminobutyrate aminotransferase / (S)-3-amino-2-methylpropionate transaminase / 5-aminovalerate transaminase